MKTLERLYQVFARYPADRAMHACDHCHTPEEVRALVETPLRDLTAAELGPYAFSAILTLGNEADLKHFLPRVFELMALDPDWDTDCEAKMTRSF